MRPVLRSFAISLAFLASVGGAPAQQAFPDPFAKAPKGRLFLTLEMKGSGRKDLSNKVEWYRLTASRKLELELAMVMPVPAAAPVVKVGGIDKDNVPMSSGMEAMKKAIDACKGDRGCEMQAAMRLSPQMLANPQAFSPHQNEGRFENWVASKGGSCAKGTALVDDEGDGMNISPPSPARPYKFQRTGKLDLPSQDAAVMDKVCQAELSVDREKGLVSLRLSEFAFAVPVSFRGQAFAVQKTTPLLEGARKLELLDQHVDLDAVQWEGKASFDKVGVATHNSGSTAAPLNAQMTWKFVRE
jgi:hypothetical protein